LVHGRLWRLLLSFNTAVKVLLQGFTKYSSVQTQINCSVFKCLSLFGNCYRSHKFRLHNIVVLTGTVLYGTSPISPISPSTPVLVLSWTPVLVQSTPVLSLGLLQLELLVVAVGEHHLPLGGRQGLLRVASSIFSGVSLVMSTVLESTWFAGGEVGSPDREVTFHLAC